jgi:hypothetical protein
VPEFILIPLSINDCGTAPSSYIFVLNNTSSTQAGLSSALISLSRNAATYAFDGVMVEVV